jgi:hypothetical protein
LVLFPVLLPAGFDAAEVVTGHGERFRGVGQMERGKQSGVPLSIVYSRCSLKQNARTTRISLVSGEKNVQDAVWRGCRHQSGPEAEDSARAVGGWFR